jgi:hypothetical protein
MTRLKISEVLVEGAQLEVKEVDLTKQPEIAKLFQETKELQEKLKKLKEVDEEQLKLVVRL